MRHTEAEENISDIEINETCAFCKRSFTRLRQLVRHYDSSCKVKQDGIYRDQEQRQIIKRKKHLCEEATKQLDAQLSMKSVTRQRTPEALAISHDIGEVDEGSSESGLSAMQFNVADGSFIAETSTIKQSSRSEERRPLQKRRRTGANISSGSFPTAEPSQSHQVYEKGDICGAASVFIS